MSAKTKIEKGAHYSYDKQALLGQETEPRCCCCAYFLDEEAGPASSRGLARALALGTLISGGTFLVLSVIIYILAAFGVLPPLVPGGTTSLIEMIVPVQVVMPVSAVMATMGAVALCVLGMQRKRADAMMKPENWSPETVAAMAAAMKTAMATAGEA